MLLQTKITPVLNDQKNTKKKEKEKKSKSIFELM